MEDKCAVGLFIFPQENFCFSLPPPQPAPSAKLLHIPVVISHHWLLVAKTEGNEPTVAAAPDSQIAAWISVLPAQHVLPAKRPARGRWQAGSKTALKENLALPVLICSKHASNLCKNITAAEQT